MAALGTRRGVVAGLIGLAAARPGRAQVAAPATPLTLSIVDVAGNLALTRPAFEAYRRRNPKLVGPHRVQLRSGAGTAGQAAGAAGGGGGWTSTWC